MSDRSLRVKGDIVITVVVSVYNTGKYLSRLIRSLLDQTYRDFEIIIVDDGSDDQNAEECDRMAKEDARIRVYHKENGGLSSARNFGIDKAKGDYIIFPDPDDDMENNYLEVLVSGYQNADVDLSICGHYVTKDGKDTRWNPGAVSKAVLDAETALRLVMRQDSFMGYAWNKLYRMELIKRHGMRFSEEHYVIQDLPFAVCYISYCNKVFYDPTPLYHYSRDNGGVTLFRKKLGDRELSGLKAYKMIAEMMRGKYPAVSDTAYASLCERSLRFMTVYLRTRMDDPEMFRMLHGTFRQYWRYFCKSDIFTRRHKCAAAVAMISPRMYYHLAKRFGHMRQGH